MPKETDGMEAYSVDLRERVLAACDAGHGTKEVAQLFGVSPAWVRRLKQRRRERGSILPLPRTYGPKPLLDQCQEQLREQVRRRPDATLEELRAALPVKVCIGTLWNTLKKLRLPFKKSRCTRRSKTVQTSSNSGHAGTSNSKR
jgi:transposase